MIKDIDSIQAFGFIFDDFLKSCFGVTSKVSGEISPSMGKLYIKSNVKTFPDVNRILDIIDSHLIDDWSSKDFDYWTDVQYVRKDHKLKQSFDYIHIETTYNHWYIFKCNICGNNSRTGLCTIPFELIDHNRHIAYGGRTWHICQIEICVTCFHFIGAFELNYLTGPDVITNFKNYIISASQPNNKNIQNNETRFAYVYNLLKNNLCQRYGCYIFMLLQHSFLRDIFPIELIGIISYLRILLLI